MAAAPRYSSDQTEPDGVRTARAQPHSAAAWVAITALFGFQPVKWTKGQPCSRRSRATGTACPNTDAVSAARAVTSGALTEMLSRPGQSGLSTGLPPANRVRSEAYWKTTVGLVPPAAARAARAVSPR